MIDKNLLDTLTEEEKAGFELHEAEQAEPEPEEDPAEEDQDGDADAADDSSDEDNADEEEEEDKPDEEDGDADADADDGLEDLPSENDIDPIPTVADKKVRLDAVEVELDEIAKKFDDGEITSAEMRQQSRKLEDEKIDLRMDIRQAETAQKTSESTWMSKTVPDFFAQNPNLKQDKTAWAMMDQEVRRLQTQAMQSGRNHLSPAILEQAKQNLQAAAAKLMGNEPPQKKNVVKKPAVPAKTREIPKTLARVPAADMTETDDGNGFAWLERLKGEKYEEALLKLKKTNPAQFAKYTLQED